jgi:hypothetical protein
MAAILLIRAHPFINTNPKEVLFLCREGMNFGQA